MGEIQPGATSYTLTELLHAVNLMIKYTQIAKREADIFKACGLHVGSGYVYQNLRSEESS